MPYISRCLPVQAASTFLGKDLYNFKWCFRLTCFTIVPLTQLLMADHREHPIVYFDPKDNGRFIFFSSAKAQYRCANRTKHGFLMIFSLYSSHQIEFHHNVNLFSDNLGPGGATYNKYW